MARIFDVIEYANEMKDELVRRFPEDGPGDFRIGSQVIVRESQRAVFFRSGRACGLVGGFLRKVPRNPAYDRKNARKYSLLPFLLI
jgi:membrane protease subunit (stomatin/prohibitin family)